MQPRSSILTLTLGALLLVTSDAAGAQSSTNAADMTAAQVTARLEAAGYTNIHGVKREGSHFDVAASKDGYPVHLHVDVVTGKIQPVANESADEEEEEHESRRHP